MNDDEDRAQLKARLWIHVEERLHQVLSSEDIKYTPRFINSLLELAYLQLGEMGSDLQAFARHAGRDVVNKSDLMLYLRKQPDLKERVTQN
ncbi:BAH_G0047560.mRNA.1.CDS.1 [Saccharomyces cerevisiae]|nr:SX2_G0031640.mRNA.1.CDS.1 [Saccharomyces cerevisiae]CAI4733609.1 BAH_G0047560.mRNA.1.CDS.1 [Saccharomyces cerevisiae]CAI4737006.1 BAG_1a_G0047570.mRNA.1.CDS.1 [Saccharomyces cerevisiae]CAI7304001.1 BAG_1a_G0047570.mRNA.1.CDS.1 [Saccharomyces cerevisiae]CAI7305970.1 BAH_G0047560.mRNA.1.CDS.1 [Saccharomyces cerevisiae]